MQGSIELPQSTQGIAAIVVSLGVARLQGNSVIEAFDDRPILAEGGKCVAAIVVGAGVCRIGGQCSVDQRDGFARLSGLRGGNPRKVQCIRVGGNKHQ